MDDEGQGAHENHNLPAVPAGRGVRRRAQHLPGTGGAEDHEHGELDIYKPPAQRLSESEEHGFRDPRAEFENWDEIRDAVFDEFVKHSGAQGATPEKAKEEAAYFEMVSDMVHAHPHWRVQPVDLDRLVEILRVYQFGYGPLEDFMHIEGLEDLYFNSFDQGFYIVRGRKHRITAQVFRDEDDLMAFVQHVARENGLEINLSKPNLDATLSDGARLNATIPPLAVGGPDFVIRQHATSVFTMDQYIRDGMLTQELADDMRRWIGDGLNIVVSGGTSSGKTSFLNAVGNAFIPSDDRILILENRKELQIETEDFKYFQTREDATRESDDDITVKDLIRWCLRKRPDRIIVGELRGGEAYDTLIAWNSGHDGSLCTIHADNPAGALDKLEQLSMERGMLSERAVRKNISRTVDVVVQVERVKGESRRRVVEVGQVFHPRKYDRRDAALVERVHTLQDDPVNGLYEVAEGGDLWLLPLYERDTEGALVKVNDIIPVQGKQRSSSRAAAPAA
jgi:pilus assembly protein CpaF